MKNTPSKLAFSLIELSVVILIIGILVLGITKGARIITASRLTSAKTLTNSSPVMLYTDNLVLWLDTTMDKSFDDAERVSGSKITNWHDIKPASGGDPLDFSSSGNSRPTYVASATNNLPALRFDGVDDVMQKNNVSGSLLTKGGNQITIFLVQKYYSPLHNSASFNWESGGNNRVSSHSVWGDGTFYFDVGDANSGGRVFFSSLPTFSNRTNIISCVRNGSIGKVRINGTQYGSSTILSSNLDTNQTAPFYISYRPPDYQHGDINEFIVFRTALKDSEISEIEKYLSAKWGVALKGL